MMFCLVFFYITATIEYVVKVIDAGRILLFIFLAFLIGLPVDVFNLDHHIYDVPFLCTGTGLCLAVLIGVLRGVPRVDAKEIFTLDMR